VVPPPKNWMSSQRVNPELIGGFVLEFDQKRYDASVANKLDVLRNNFTKNFYIKEF
jgi:F-type H+-transporting ATPase subunit delta